MSVFLRQRGHTILKGTHRLLSSEQWCQNGFLNYFISLVGRRYGSPFCGQDISQNNATLCPQLFGLLFWGFFGGGVLFFKHPSILQQRGLCSADFHCTQRKVFQEGSSSRHHWQSNSVNIKDHRALWLVLTNIVSLFHFSSSSLCHIIFFMIIIITFCVCSIFYIILRPFGMTSPVHSFSW